MSPVLLNPYLGAGGGGVTPIAPNAITGLLCWYKRGDFYSDNGSTLQTTNGGAVQQWSDSSGNGHHLNRTGNRPTLDTSVTHLTKNTLRFDPSGGFKALNIPSITSQSTCDSFIVLKSASDSPSIHRTIYGLNQAGSGSSFGTYYPNTSGHITSTFGDGSRHDWGAHTTADAFHVFEEDCSAASRDGLLDNVSIGTQASPATHTVPFGGNFFGTDGDVANPWDGWVFEWVIFSAILSSGDRAGLYAYLTT